MFNKHLLCAKLFINALNLTTRTKKELLSLHYRVVNEDIEMVGTQANLNLISKPLFFALYITCWLIEPWKRNKKGKLILNLFYFHCFYFKYIALFLLRLRLKIGGQFSNLGNNDFYCQKMTLTCITQTSLSSILLKSPATWFGGVLGLWWW